jgi:8-oxo-dGTP pyrophosphatase MutT (NUDIX family)
MDKFTKQQKIDKLPKPNNTLYQGKYVNVISYKDWEIIEENSCVIILPYLIDEGYILMRSEYVPTYQYKYKDSPQYKSATNFLTIISGSLKKDENPINAVRRELYEEAGLILSNTYSIDIDRQLNMTKGSLGQYFTCLMPLHIYDYKFTLAPTDGSKNEKLSRTVKVSLGDLDEIITNDLITDYMILKLKNEFKLK